MSGAAPPSRGAQRLPAWFPALIAAAVAVGVFRGAAAYGFAQDDFAALARAAGLLPRFTEPWRWLSLQGFFDLMRPLAGLNAFPYHLVSLAGHALATVMVFRLLARFTGRPAAFAGAVFFAAHPASFTAVYWISTIGDLWALVFALRAMEWAGRGRALPAALGFAVSLLCKESLLLVPLVLIAWRALDRPRTPGARRIADPAVLWMSAVAAAYLVYFVVQNGLTAAPAPGAEPYAIRPGRHVLENAATYLGWTANPWLPTVTGWTDAIDPSVYGWGLGLAAAWLAGAFVPALRARGWLHAGILYAAFIAPVLPLERHTYHYYLYGALAGAALALAALLDAAASWLAARPAPRNRGGRKPAPVAPVRASTGAVSWALAMLVALACALNGAAVVRKVETAPFGHPELRAEPIIDRARIAAHVREALEGAALPEGTTLLFYSPEARAMAPKTDPERETYWERNVKSALYGGVAARLFAPRVSAVRFVTRPEPGDSLWYALYDVTGRTRIVHGTTPREAAARRAVDPPATSGHPAADGPARP